MSNFVGSLQTCPLTLWLYSDEDEHRHEIDEHDHLNWLKANRKVLNAGKMKAERVEKFRNLLELTEQYRRKNQYEWSR